MKQPNNTRLIDISYLLSNTTSSLYLKMENEQITESHKYRLVYGMMRNYLDYHSLSEFKGFVEATSGNTGLALVELAQQINKQVILFANQSLSPKIKANLDKYNNVILKLSSDADQAYADVKTFQNNNLGYVHLDQYNNIHGTTEFFRMGLEILREVPEINCCVMGVGTGATITGLSDAIFKYGNRPETFVVGCTINDEWLTIPGWKNFKVSKPGSIIITANERNLIHKWTKFEIGQLTHVQSLSKELFKLGFVPNLSTVGNILAGIEIGNKYNNYNIVTICTGKK